VRTPMTQIRTEGPFTCVRVASSPLRWGFGPAGVIPFIVFFQLPPSTPLAGARSKNHPKKNFAKPARLCTRLVSLRIFSFPLLLRLRTLGKLLFVDDFKLPSSKREGFKVTARGHPSQSSLLRDLSITRVPLFPQPITPQWLLPPPRPLAVAPPPQSSTVREMTTFPTVSKTTMG